MKLTNNIRDAFVRGALADVPTVDYDEQMRKLVQDAVVESLPPKIKAIWKDSSLKAFVKLGNVCTPRGFSNVAVPATDGWTGMAVPSSVEAQVAELVAANDKQRAMVSDLTAKLKQAAYACTTRKQLTDLLPEFQKYLPADDAAATRSVPVIANVVADFVKAGWPKGVK